MSAGDAACVALRSVTFKTLQRVKRREAAHVYVHVFRCTVCDLTDL